MFTSTFVSTPIAFEFSLVLVNVLSYLVFVRVFAFVCIFVRVFLVVAASEPAMLNDGLLRKSAMDDKFILPKLSNAV